MKVTTKARGKKKSPYDALSLCPVDGAGWCPYPFSIAQLKRRLKAKAAALEAAAKSESTTTKAKTKAKPEPSSKKPTKQPAARASR